MGARLIKIASVYFVLGIALGMFMSISHKFDYASVHAHINLLGWASLALAGIVYHVFPKSAESVLGKIHFWLHNVGLPIMMIGLFLLVSGVAGMEPVIAVGGTVTSIGVVLFMINVLKNVGAAEGTTRSKR
ncbi:cbb3-type cytochrome c oxidase subunit I [Paenibacillus sp. NPDC056579]|uniref:cbb3-type cytochrome c oxidase subunit I n=1 Tax=unclassified Paenibacillus TaxID=185978 RepID=UPI001EF78B2B|nr:cbb3-type cytochrome c oxidase subunit I [Paenibacillus sp. H1-7]ULL13943.1 cytochrome-c oxidase [Paenibacillus sp. H1-7]